MVTPHSAVLDLRAGLRSTNRDAPCSSGMDAADRRTQNGFGDRPATGQSTPSTLPIREVTSPLLNGRRQPKQRLAVTVSNFRSGPDSGYDYAADVDLIVFAFGHSDIRVVGDLPSPPAFPDPSVPGRFQTDMRRWGQMLEERCHAIGADTAAAELSLPKLEPILERIARESDQSTKAHILIVATDQAETGSGFEHTDTITLVPFLLAVLPAIADRNGLQVDGCSAVQVVGDPTSPAVCWNGASRLIERISGFEGVRSIHLCLVGGTRALGTAISIRFSLADAAHSLPAISSWIVKEGSAEADELPTLLGGAIHRQRLLAMAESGRFADVATAIRAAPGFGLEEAAALSELGDALVTLDIDRALRFAPADLKGDLEALRMPTSRYGEASVAAVTGDISALVALILATIEIRWRAGECGAALALAHLVAEYGAHLAWQPVLGHALDPIRLRNHVDTPGSLYGVDESKCQIARGGYATEWASAVRRGEFGDEGGFADAMASTYARIGADFLVCGLRHRVEPRDWPVIPWFCTRNCAVWSSINREAQRALVGRVLVASLFKTSPLMQLRHRSPNAHFFAVPSPDDIESAAVKTVRGIGDALEGVAWSAAPNQPALWRSLSEDVDLRDLPSVVENLVRFISGDETLRASGIIDEVRRRLVDAVDKEAADDPPDRTR